VVLVRYDWAGLIGLTLTEGTWETGFGIHLNEGHLEGWCHGDWVGAKFLSGYSLTGDAFLEKCCYHLSLCPYSAEDDDRFAKPLSEDKIRL
jgi:hypothetical protein